VVGADGAAGAHSGGNLHGWTICSFSIQQLTVRSLYG
jgi:hypothetical protein